MARAKDTIMTIGELAAYLKLSRSTLYHLARAGKVPGVKVGRHWRFHREAIDRWVSTENGLPPIQEEKA
jgi:excisionase family DNA binding protein